MATWLYNESRPHSFLGDRTPAIYVQRSAPGMQPDGALARSGGFASRPVAPPSLMGSNAERTQTPIG